MDFAKHRNNLYAVGTLKMLSLDVKSVLGGYIINGLKTPLY